MQRVFAGLALWLALVAAFAIAPAAARLSVTHLSSFGAKPMAAAGGGTPVVYQAAAAYVQTTEVQSPTDTFNFSVSHTKDPDTTMLLVAIGEPGENDNTAYVTPGTGSTMTYCGSPMTYVTGSQSQFAAQFDDNDQFDLTWWWIRGPSAGSCTITFSVKEIGAGSHADANGTGATDPPANVVFAVMEFSQVINSGDPYEAVSQNTNSDTSSTTGNITLTPTLGRMAVWATSHDGSATLVGAAPSVNLGSVDANIGDSGNYHLNSGHYDAVGSKAITVTWGLSVSRNHEISGFHLKPN